MRKAADRIKEEAAYDVAKEKLIRAHKDGVSEHTLTDMVVEFIKYRLGDSNVKKNTMKRTNNGEHVSEVNSSFCLPRTMVDTMTLIAKRAGVSRSRVFRAAIDEFLATNKDTITRLRATSEAEAAFIADIRGIRT